MSLYRDGLPFQFAESRGPWACAHFIDDGATYTAGKSAPVVGPGVPMELLQLPLRFVSTSDAYVLDVPFVANPSITKASIFEASNCTLQKTQYPQAVLCRLRDRITKVEKLNAIEVCIPGVKGYGSRYNLDRNGEWDGRVSGTLADGRTLHVLVVDAREKYPRGYCFANGNLYLTLHTNIREKDTSKQGVQDLAAYLTGTLSAPLPPEYAALLTNDPDVKNAALEVSASEQASRVSEFHLGLDFWLSIGESVDPQPPLVLLDGFESPIWSKPKPGVSDAELRSVDERLTDLCAGWLAAGPQGSILYGDFQEQPNSFYRVRGASYHYFTGTERWRAFLRGNQLAYNQARVIGNHCRDHVWCDGAAYLYKCLVPFGSFPTVTGHWADSEALLFAWLVDGDGLSLLEYQRWLKAAASAPQPTRNDRESFVFARQCRVAHWFTGEAKWKQWADVIEQRAMTQPISEGALFMPLWTDKVLPGLADNHEGALNVAKLAATGNLEAVEGLIRHGQWPVAGNRIGPGLLGECYVGLQFERIADYYRGKRLTAKHRVIYGTPKGVTAKIFIEKSDAKDSTIRIALGQRQQGDIPDVAAWLISPDGARTQIIAPGVFPRYPLPAEQRGFIDGWQVAVKSFPLTGPAGRYVLEIGGDRLMLHGPVSQYPEHQLCYGEFLYDGQDASGNWPTGSVLVGSN